MSLPAAKTLTGIWDAQVTAGETATASVSRQDYDYAIIDLFLLGEEATTTPTAIVLAEGDTTASYSAISTGGTDFTIPSVIASVGNAPTIVRFNVDLRARKKLLKLSVAAATKTEVKQVLHLYRGDTRPSTATQQGVGVQVSI